MVLFDQLQDIVSCYYVFFQYLVVLVGVFGFLYFQGYFGDFEVVVEFLVGYVFLGYFQQCGFGLYVVVEVDVGFVLVVGVEVFVEGVCLYQQGVFVQFGDLGGVVFVWVMVDCFFDVVMDVQVVLFVVFQVDGGDFECIVVWRFGDVVV